MFRIPGITPSAITEAVAAPAVQTAALLVNTVTAAESANGPGVHDPPTENHLEALARHLRLRRPDLVPRGLTAREAARVREWPSLRARGADPSLPNGINAPPASDLPPPKQARRLRPELERIAAALVAVTSAPSLAVADRAAAHARVLARLEALAAAHVRRP